MSGRYGKNISYQNPQTNHYYFNVGFSSYWEAKANKFPYLKHTALQTNKTLQKKAKQTIYTLQTNYNGSLTVLLSHYFSV